MSKQNSSLKVFRWTSNLAYAIGLLVTDGNLSSDGRHISFRSSDYQLIKVFKKCMGVSNSIKKTKKTKTDFEARQSYKIQIGNVRMYRWLISIGLFPAKTYSISKIKIPLKYFRDFLRGHLDGDGSILTYVDRYNVYRGRQYINSRVFVRFISASKDHMVWLRELLFKLRGMKGALICSKPRDEKRVPLWQVKLAKKDSMKLLKWIYYKSGLPSLKRKERIARKVLMTYPYIERRKYEFISPVANAC